MLERKQTRDIEPREARAAFVPESLDVEARTVELVWTTGARVLRGFFERWWEELSTDSEHVRLERLNDGAPLLDVHRANDSRAVLGVVESARLEDGKGIAVVRFAKEGVSRQADQIFELVRDGIMRNVSVGYTIHRLEKQEESIGEVPIYRATDWEPFEISMVPVGADAGAGVRSAAGTNNNPCEFIDEGREMETEKKQPQSGATTEAPITTGATSERAASPAELAAERVAERERIAAIHRVARSLELSDELVSQHVDGGTSADKFRELAIDEYGKKPSPVSDGARVEAVSGGDASDKFVRGASDWLVMRSALGSVVRKAGQLDGVDVRLDPGEFRGMTFTDLARHALRLRGVSAPSERKRLFAVALKRGGGLASASDFPVLLENALHKMLMAQYAITPDTWSKFCAKGSVSDFRPHPRYKLGSFGGLDVVNEAGEFTHVSVPDGEKESISASTKGNIIGVTRQMLINDDMGAFAQLPIAFGRAARLSIERDVYAALTANSGMGPTMNDGNPMFHADHSNVGGGAALSEAALDADRVVMAEQLDVSGNDYTELRPAVLLVPTALGATARKINDAEFSPDAGAGLNEPNSVRGLYRDVVDTPRLAGTRRYSFADPAVAPCLEVAFLDGQENPYLEMREIFEIDGIQWKVRLDYGVGGVDFRGAVTDAGA